MTLAGASAGAMVPGVTAVLSAVEVNTGVRGRTSTLSSRHSTTGEGHLHIWKKLGVPMKGCSLP